MSTIPEYTGDPKWWEPFKVVPEEFNLHPSPAPTPPPDPILERLKAMEARLKRIEEMLE